MKGYGWGNVVTVILAAAAIVVTVLLSTYALFENRLWEKGGKVSP